MTPLEEHLVERIVREGPMTVADYMSACLLDPKHGYYATRDPLGVAGDFITAPEVSQMFGEVLGLAMAQAWIERGRPDRFLLVELGPGRGTLMADLLRSAKAVSGFASAAEVHLVEASPVLRTMQTETISAPITHHDRLETVPAGPIFLVANEFFDVLPTRQFIRQGASWRERVVGLANGALTFGLTDPIRLDAVAHRLDDTHEGDLVEYSAAAAAIAGEIGARIAQHGGMAIILDYGDWQSLGDTFQAVRAHEKEGPLDTPGQADLTCHVAFETLARAAAPARSSMLTTQGILLEKLGITARANALAAGADKASLDGIVAAHRRLTHPDEMGTLFKAMALYRSTEPVPPGFDP